MAWRTPSDIDEASPKHHVAAAFAMHGPRRGEAREPLLEALGIGERRGMQLRIAARQPAGIAIFPRRLVGKRREGHDLGANAPPAAQYMRIDEGEGGVARERDALARRRQGGDRVRLGCQGRRPALG